MRLAGRVPNLVWLAGALAAVSLCHSAEAQEIHHYLFVGMDRDKARDTAFLNTPALEGAQVAYFWKQLEPAKDEYDFSLIRQDLDFLRSHGKRLFVQLQDVTFSPSRVAVPQYITRDSIYHGGVALQYTFRGDNDSTAKPLGWVARRWDPAVRTRLEKLLIALGREFDGQIAGFNTEETAITFGTSGKYHPPGFSPAGYRDAVIEIMRSMKAAFPRSVVIEYGNFMPGEWRRTDDRGYLASVYRAAREMGVGMGGPDLLPYDRAQLGSSYPLLREIAGAVPTSIAVQDGNLAAVDPATGKPEEVANIFAFAREYLRVNYIFWGTEEPYYSQQVIPFLRSGATNR